MQEYKDQNNSEYENFLRSDNYYQYFMTHNKSPWTMHIIWISSVPFSVAQAPLEELPNLNNRKASH